MNVPADEWDPRELLGDVDLVQSIPLRALLLSFASLFVPVLAAVLFPDWTGEEAGLLIWLTALVPAFLLTYYRGWQGASLALAMGMAALSMTQVALLLAGVKIRDWTFLMALVVVYIAISLGIGWLSELLHRQRRLAERMALTDSLTGMPNRRHAVVFLEAAFAAAERGIPLGIVLFDLDDFKGYNDAWGHPAGDDALKTVGGLLLRSTRRMNLTARWGGEEFLSILSDCDLEGGRVFAERMLAEVRHAFPDGKLTMSAGVAEYTSGMKSPAELLAAADQALYAAKGAGKDCVRWAPSTPTSPPGADEAGSA